MSGIASAVGAGLGLAGTLVSNAQNANNQYFLNEQSYKLNSKLAEEAYKRNVQLWKMQNAYNTPAMQAQRLRAAGINPNMAFGAGVDVSSGNASDAPQLNYAEWNPKAPYFENPVGPAIQAAGTASDIVASIEQNKLTQARVVLTLENAGLSQIQARSLVNKDSREAAMFGWKLEEAKKKVDQLEASIRGTNLDNDIKEFAVSVQKERFEWERDAAAADLELTKARKADIEKAAAREDKLANATIALYNAKRKHEEELTKLCTAQIELTKEQKAQVHDLRQKIQAETKEINQNCLLLKNKTAIAYKDWQYYLWNHSHVSIKDENELFQTTEFKYGTPVPDDKIDIKPRK